MNEGWIKLHRKFLEWEWYNDINTKILFLHIILKTNYEDKKRQGTLIKRGSFITSIENLASETSLTRQQIRTSLDKLKNSGEINTQTTNKYTLIIVNKYAEFQDDNKQDIQKVTNKQQTNNKQITTTKEYKEIKNIKKEEYIINKQIYSEEFCKVFDSFKEMRKTIKKPLTPKAEELILSKLSKLANTEKGKIQVLEQSIMNSWQDVYPLKIQQTKQHTPPKKQVTTYMIGEPKESFAKDFLVDI